MSNFQNDRDRPIVFKDAAGGFVALTPNGSAIGTYRTLREACDAAQRAWA